MRYAKMRAIGRMSFRRLAPLPRLRRRAIRTADSDIYSSLDATTIAEYMGQIEGDYSAVIGIFPGMGGYWEAMVKIGDEYQELRSYKLSSLMSEIIELLRAYERSYG